MSHEGPYWEVHETYIVVSCDRAGWKQLALAVRPSLMLPDRFLASGLELVFLLEFASRPSVDIGSHPAGLAATLSCESRFRITTFRMSCESKC